MIRSTFLGRHVKYWREQRGLQQKELAQKVGISAAHLCTIENQKRLPSVPVMQALAQALRVSEQDLISPPHAGPAYTADLVEMAFQAWDSEHARMFLLLARHLPAESREKMLRLLDRIVPEIATVLSPAHTADT